MKPCAAKTWDFVRLKAKASLCTGCDLCVGACVASHGNGDYGLYQARLRIEQGNQPGQHKVMFCTICKKCIDVCPTDALRWHPESGAVELLPERCDTCAKCVDICPTKVIIHSEAGLTFARWTHLGLVPDGLRPVRRRAGMRPHLPHRGDLHRRTPGFQPGAGVGNHHGLDPTRLTATASCASI